MSDLFGRKAKAERDAIERSYNELMLSHERLAADNNRLEAIRRELADIIRETDQAIFNMSMQSSWDKMRPIFNQLQVGQESRMRAESNRINTILKQELIEIYHK